MTVSAASYSASVPSVAEVSAKISTGMAFGFILRNCGMDGMSPGRSGTAALMAAWTSRAALSTLRDRSN